MQEPHRWRPLTCEQVAALLDGATFPWWICGGHAIDLLLGRTTRAHGDVDVGVLRGDQPALFERLTRFEVHLAKDGQLRELSSDERGRGTLDPDHHGLWCRPRGESDWALEILLNDGDREEWIFRRHPALRRPLSEVIHHSEDGIPYLAPELQLLFKAKARRQRDEQDFSVALPVLDATQRDWLRGALHRAYPDHAWLDRLGR